MSTFLSQSYKAAQLKATRRENERLNKESWSSMAQQINTVNLQRGLLQQQTGTDLLNINKEATRAASASSNNAAAAGIVGDSVDEAVSDVARQNQESMATTKQNELIQEINLDTSVQDIVANAVAQQRYSEKPASFLQQVGNTIGGTVMGVVDKYVSNAMDYGSWSPPSSSASTSSSPALSTSSGNAGTYFSSSAAQKLGIGSSIYGS